MMTEPEFESGSEKRLTDLESAPAKAAKKMAGESVAARGHALGGNAKHDHD